MGVYARHIKNGKSMPYVVESNKKWARDFAQHRRCMACGCLFTKKRPPSMHDRDLCESCRADL